MAVIDEIIRLEKDLTISFGDYLAVKKKKLEGFEMGGDLYKVKTHKEVTRLEKNGALLMETIPGAAVHNFKLADKVITFAAEGFGDTQITMELEPDNEYKIVINSTNVGQTKTNLSGKLSFSAGLGSDPQMVSIEKLDKEIKNA